MERKTFLSAGLLFALKPNFQQLHPTLLQSITHGNDEEYWTALRAMFPLTENKIFLNNGTMGITPYPVLDKLRDAFSYTAKNATYPGHNEDLEKAIGALIGADSKEITITKNVSEGNNHVCWGIPLKKGDEVILTRHEHVGGGMPWLNRARLEGIVIKVIDLGKTAQETLDIIKKSVTKKTKVIAVPHIPCTIGQILPVKEICAFARSKNIISAIDGAHPLGMIQFNLAEIGCDYYYGCLHKWALGPLGVGFLYINKQILDKTRCTHIAAYSAENFNMSAVPPLLPKLVPSAHRFTYGTFSGPLLEGALAALEFYKTTGPEKIEIRIRSLAKYLQDHLLEFGNKIEILTPTEEISRGAQISFRITNGVKNASSEFVSHCYKKEIVLRYVGESDIDCVRVSTHYYNSTDDIDRMLEELKKYIG